jgi:hypothetical protein
MSHIRRPQLVPGPGHDLLSALRELYLQAGEPSMRTIERLTQRAISRDTVYRVLTSTTVPRWESLKPVVLALGGDVGNFHHLWVTARRAEEDLDGQS